MLSKPKNEIKNEGCTKRRHLVYRVRRIWTKYGEMQKKDISQQRCTSNDEVHDQLAARNEGTPNPARLVSPADIALTRNLAQVRG